MPSPNYYSVESTCSPSLPTRRKFGCIEHALKKTSTIPGITMPLIGTVRV